MTTKEQIQAAALALYGAAASGTTIPPVRQLIGDKNIEAAYLVQEINVDRVISEGGKVVGKKIGLTSFAVQKQLGVDQPDYGILFDQTWVREGKLSYSELVQPKAEAEIAFIMAEDLDGDINLDRLIDSIDYASVAIEIVGSRVADWDIRITDTIADNASASHFILGDSKIKLDKVDLVNCKMQMTKNGEITSEGNGKACMDNPLNAALWLAKKMAEMGNPLKKGEILLSGALGPMVVIEQGDTFEVSIEGLGSVSLEIV